jgi:multidrug resistance efflux pump
MRQQNLNMQKELLPVMCLTKSSRVSKIMAYTLGWSFLILIFLITILPWQQNVYGMGKVIAFQPLDRRINLEAPVSGRVKKLFVVEGQKVKKGDMIIEIQDNDPQLLTNLRLQRDAVMMRKAAAKQRVINLNEQVQQLEGAKLKALEIAEQRVNAERIAAQTSQLNHQRSTILVEKGLISRRDMELAQLSLESTAANLESALASLTRTDREMTASISNIKANRGSAEAEVAATDREMNALEILINQNMQQKIEATRDGTILNITATEGSYLRPGSLIGVIIPDTQERFVEVWLDGNDMPLVQSRMQNKEGELILGSHVRLQFEGWPALQFSGWPSVGIGTFGGEVIFVDAADDGKGKFRVVIAPQPDAVFKDGKNEVQDWPDGRFLRQGVRVKGWVMLQQIPLWKELWRQLNGFPPALPEGSEPKKA